MLAKPWGALVIVATIITGATADAKGSNDVESIIDVLSRYKQQAEQDAYLAAGRCHAPPQCGFRLKNYSMFHGRAQHSFDRLIRGIVKEFKRSRNINDAPHLRHMIGDAARQFGTMKLSFERLKARDMSVHKEPVRINMSDAIRQSVQEIRGGSKRTKGRYRNGGKAHRRTIVEVLNDLQWRRFDRIRRDVSELPWKAKPDQRS